MPELKCSSYSLTVDRLPFYVSDVKMSADSGIMFLHVFKAWKFCRLLLHHFLVHRECKVIRQELSEAARAATLWNTSDAQFYNCFIKLRVHGFHAVGLI